MPFAGAKSCEYAMRMVRDLADRIHVLDCGRIIADGEPEAVLNDPENLRAFGAAA